MQQAALRAADKPKSVPMKPEKANLNTKHWYIWQIFNLADALQVSIDYLLGRTDEMEPKIILEDVLEEDEIELILKYRSLSKEKKIKLSGIAIGLSE